MAAYSALKHFQYFLEGREFTIYTDHKPLSFAFKQKPEKASQRQLRHLDFIGQHTVDIRYVPGKDNTVADALSRLNAITMPSPVNYSILAKEQQEDEELKNILNSPQSLCLKQMKLPDVDVEIYCNVSSTNIRPYITPNLRKPLFEYLHGLSHPGVNKTLVLVKSRFVWPSISKDVRSWTKCCIPCQSSKISKTC